MSRPSRPRPTIKEVAKLCNVSQCTVSLALSGSRGGKRVSDVTRKRIQAAARQLGYKANSLGRDLQRGYSNQALLIIVSWNLATSHAATAMSISRAAARSNLLLTVHVADDDASAEQFLIQQNLHHLGGVLVLWDSRAFERSSLMTARNEGVPVIALLPGQTEAVSTVTIDRELAGYLAGRHLRELGHTRIGFIGDLATRPNTTRSKLDGLKRAVASPDIVPASLHVAQETDFGFSGGRSGMNKLLQRYPEMTAVFCINDAMALGALEAAKAAGKTNFSAVGFGNSVEGRYWVPKLTTFSLGCDEVATAALELLQSQRTRGISVTETILLPTSLIARESTMDASLCGRTSLAGAMLPAAIPLPESGVLERFDETAKVGN